MAMVLNNSGRVLKVRGAEIHPREMADVPLSHSELRDHLFVRSGLLEVSGGRATSAPKRKPKQDDSESESE